MNTHEEVMPSKPMSTAPASSAGPRSGSRPWTLALTSVAFFTVALDMLVVITALPAIRREFGASLAALQWAVNAFTLAYASGIITGAALGDRFGRRRIFGIGFLIFTAAAVACALSATPERLIAARVVQGTGAAIVMPLSLTILTTAFPPEKRGTIVGKNDRTVHPDLQRFVAKRMGATIYEVDSSHVPMLSNPKLVIDVIRAAANA